jgi:hypothetical protein
MNALLSRMIMEFLQVRARGEENAVPREDVLAELRLFEPKLPDRTMRELYAKLPVCSCERGLYIPIRPGEVEAFKLYMTKKNGPFIAAQRVMIILAYYPKLRPAVEGQARLF